MKFVGVVLFCWIVAGPVHAQTLLETFVFMHNSGWIDIDDLKESADGKLLEPPSRFISKGSPNVWSVVDRDNCILRNDTPGLQLSTTFYLNHVIPGSRTSMPRQNVYRLTMYGDKAIVCTSERGVTDCEQKLEIDAINDYVLLRFRKAIDFVFTKYCKFAQPAKPF
jgi:hypothetical protein